MDKPVKPLVRDLLRSNKPEKVFRSYSLEKQAKVILHTSRKFQKKLLARLTESEVHGFLTYLDLDKAADVLQNTSGEKKERVLSSVNKRVKEKLKLLMRFDPKTAAGLMTLNYVAVEESSTVKQVLRAVEKHEEEAGKAPSIVVVRDGLFVGELFFSTLVKLSSRARIKKHVQLTPTVRYDLPASELPRVFKEHACGKLVVVDDKRVLGVVYAHDVLKVLEQADPIKDFAGVSREEEVYDSFQDKVRSRYKWLILNLATAFLAASVVGLFEDTIAAFTLLAIYMPVVAGMGGNAGTQTMAVFIRGIALNRIDLDRKAIKAIRNEMLAGATNGFITGVIAAIIAVLWNHNPLLGLVIGVAMVINLVIAGFFGAIIPLIMKRLGKDPATSATIFITTATDVLGFFVFLGLASAVI